MILVTINKTLSLNPLLSMPYKKKVIEDSKVCKQIVWMKCVRGY